MRVLKCVWGLFLALVPAASGQWQEQSSGVQVQLRGISAVSDSVAWASGANGTILHTRDAGKIWEKVGGTIPDSEKLDFRNIRAFNDKIAYVLSIGPGELSRIYKTTDGGRHWNLEFTNHSPKAFYDCFAFWDRNHGIALSDSVDGRFPLIATVDGIHWKPLVPQAMPAALPNEGAFAASGTCIATFGKQDVWFATGGPAARVFHSADRGRNWTVSAAPIMNGAASQGIFSIAFWDKKRGVAVGGDYMHPENADKTAAWTEDGGKSWNLSGAFPSGYRSAAAILPPASPRSAMKVVAVGSNGWDLSRDAGKTWVGKGSGEWNAVSVAGTSAWAVGPHGRIGYAQVGGYRP
jgi:photosystem II stability/assembly factor-like uncharacterized protein